MTERQQAVLEFVEEFVARQGYPPTVREVATHFGIQPRAAADHLEALNRKGQLHREPGRSRGLTLSRLREPVVEVPLLGRIAAGQPLLAAENVEDTLPLPRAWVRDEEA
ncbi:MAG: repressor LexA, partial [Deltaproteobacteria bacterium]|nr:repressor LexA [Deltaproteobacteria bacterium]